MVTLRDILNMMSPYQHVRIFIQITTDDGCRDIIEYESSEAQNFIAMPIANKEVVLLSSNPFYGNEINVSVRE